MKKLIHIILIVLIASLGMQSMSALAAQTNPGKQTLSFWRDYDDRDYGHWWHWHEHYYYPRHVYYHRCVWIAGHYNRAGHFIRGHRVC